MKRIILSLAFAAFTLSAVSQIVAAANGSNLKMGFVDANNRWVVQPIYATASWDKEARFGFFMMDFDDKTRGLVNEQGKIIFPQGKYYMYYKREDDYIAVERLIEDENHQRDMLKMEASGFGLATRTGQLVIPAQYAMGSFRETHGQLVKVSIENEKSTTYFDRYLDGVWSLQENREIIPCKYNGIVFDPQYIAVRIWVNDGNSWGAFSYDGKEIIPCGLYAGIKWAADDIFSVYKNGKWGYYAHGKEVIPCIYDDAVAFTGDVAMVKQDGEVKMLKNPLKDATIIKVDVASLNKGKAGSPVFSRYPKPDSDVDKNIPVAQKQAETTFAFIVANENYPDAPVPYSLNDGRMFREYCQKTLGIPEKNINMYEDATFGSIITAVEKMKSIAEAYDGEASVIFYYAGHGFPDDKQATAYLLPIDGDATSITSTGYSLAKLYKEMASLKLKSAIVFLDACFSGAKREDEMLTSARGVALKVKEDKPQGNMLVFSAAQGDETAHQLEEKHHGLFTYCLLKELQASQGEVDLGTLTDNVTKQVKRQSVVINNKRQTPSAIPSPSLQASWRTMKLK